MAFPARSSLVRAALSLAFRGALVGGACLAGTAARSQFTVFDPSNYSQNLLTAARSLQQISNQIRMLQNQTQSLLNEARNLTTVSFPELTTLQLAIQKIDQLMAQASNIQFHVTGLDQQYRALFPSTFDPTRTNDHHLVNARTRLTSAMAAYQQTMTVQAQVVENVADDESALDRLVARSQGAQGALQVQQTTNQLLALVAKQQFQIEHMMAAQYRVDALDRARRTQAHTDGGGTTAKFLGSGSAYTPH